MDEAYNQWRIELAQRLNISVDKLDAFALRQARIYLDHAYYEAHLTVDEILDDLTSVD